MRRGLTPVRITGCALACAAVLAGCASNPSTPSEPQVFGLASPPKADALPPLPRFQEPAYAALLDKANAEYRRWLADPAGYLGPVPEQAAPWPCAVPQAERDQLAGIPDPNGPAARALQARLERATGTKRGSFKPATIEGAQVHLRKGTCVNGQLQGDVELLAVYTSVMTRLDTQTRSHIRQLTRFTAQAGKPVGTVFVAYLPGTSSQFPPIPMNIKQKYLEGKFTLRETATGRARGREVEIYYRGTESSAPFVSTRVDISQYVGQVVPLKDDRWISISYYGTTKVREAHYKGDVAHGRTVGYAYVYKGSKEPLSIPASEACYDNGELVKSVTCDID